MSSLFGPGASNSMNRTGGNPPPNPAKIGGMKVKQMQQFTPEQMELFQSLFGHLGPESFLSQLAGGEEGAFEEMERPALRQFSGLLGGLASRFSGMGQGGRHSSGFQNTATQASSDFAQQLQSRRQDLQRQAMQDLFGLSGSLLGQRPYEQFLEEPKESKSWWEKLLGAGLPIAGAALGSFGGPAGAQIGGAAGSAASRAFF